MRESEFLPESGDYRHAEIFDREHDKILYRECIVASLSVGNSCRFLVLAIVFPVGYSTTGSCRVATKCVSITGRFTATDFTMQMRIVKLANDVREQ